MEILRRDVELALNARDVPRDWCGGDAYQTTFMVALSLLFPEGERFFVDSVKQLASCVTTDELRRDVAGFIGQEAMHGREHRAFNELVVAHGYTAAPRISAVLGRVLQLVRRVMSRRSQLAVTCALEHFTAMLAETLLASDAMRGDLDPSVRRLWVWHALEESEHKAVAFDVYRAARGGYLRRAGIMIATTMIFFLVQSVAHAWLMAQRGILWKPWRWLRGIARQYVWPGYLLRLIPAYLSYFRPSFHPNDRDTRALVSHWQRELFPG